MKFLTLALIAIFAIALFAGNTEAQRGRTRTVCGNTCTNQCVFGTRQVCSNRTVRTCSRYVNQAAGCAQYGVRKTKYCSRHSAYCVRHQTSTQRYCAAHKRVCVAKKNTYKNVCKKHRRGCVSVGTVTKRVCAARGPKRCAAYKTTSKTVCKAYGNKCAQHKQYSTNVCKQYGKKCNSVAYKINRNCIRKVNHCVAHKNVKTCTKDSVCKQYKTVKTVTCAKKGPKCTKYVTRNIKTCTKKGKKCVKTVKVPKRCVAFGTKVTKPVLKSICTRYVTKKGKKVCAKKENFRCGAVKKVKYCKKYAPATTRCAQYVQTCLAHKKSTKKECVQKKIVCLANKTSSKKVCVRRGPSSCKTTKVCTKKVTKCTHYKTTRVSFCKQYANVCTKSEKRTHLKCVRVQKACTKYGTQHHKTCIRYESPCTRYVNKVEKKCNKYGNICTLNQRVIASTQCVRYANTCARYANTCARYAVRTIKGRCLQSANRCVAYAYRTTRHCTRTKFVSKCAGYVNRAVRSCVAQRACVRTVRRCTRTCRTVVVRGDPHTNENGKEEHSGQFAGLFRLVEDGDLKILGYYKKVGHGSVIRSLFVTKAGKSALLRAGKSAVRVSGDLELKRSGNFFEVAVSEAKVEIVYDPKTKSFSVGGKLGGNIKGLLVDLNAAKENIAEKQSFQGKVWLSKARATLRRIAVFKCTVAKKQKGEELCAAIKSRTNDFKDCVKDYCLTGLNFVHQYQQNEAAAAKLN